MEGENNAPVVAKTEKTDYKERFQFVLSVNDNIICQRYFKINGFNEESVYSVELKDTIDDIVKFIADDLTSKSRIYTWYTYDSTYEESEFHTELEPAWSVTFKFAFLMDEREVISKVFDGTVYPKFVRNNVDLVNKRSRYEQNDGSNRNPFEVGLMNHYEVGLMKKMIFDRPDFSYIIINLLCDVCSSVFSSQYKYTTVEEYGDKTYELNVENIVYED